jgi:rhodanese-related sulfurtransferase
MMTGIQTIAADELRQMLAENPDVRLVDVLPEETYKKGHIPGALSLPIERLAGEGEREFDKQDTIVVYCSNTTCPLSSRASHQLVSLGFEHVFDFEDGKEGWVAAGFPVVS